MRRSLRPRRTPRRTLLAAVAVGGAITFTRRSTARARAITPAAPPSWPPITLEGVAVADGAVVLDAPAARRWVAPLDGECPLEHPVKANDRSRIFHPPSGRSYARTRADRCYTDPASAAADGYRAAKA